MPEGETPPKIDAGNLPQHYRSMALNASTLRARLAQAPPEWSAQARTSPLILSLPLPDGSLAHFRVEKSPIMAPELAAKFPEITTYALHGLDLPAASGRMDWTPLGLHAIIYTAEETILIDPASRERQDRYIVYRRADTTPPAWDEEDIIGEVEETIGADEPATAQDAAATNPIGDTLRIYRLAMAATGEFTVKHGGVANAMAVIVSKVNRVNALFERDTAIRMELVANNDLVIFTDPSTDPYSDGNPSKMLGQNQVTLDKIIGNEN